MRKIEEETKRKEKNNNPPISSPARRLSHNAGPDFSDSSLSASASLVLRPIVPLEFRHLKSLFHDGTEPVFKGFLKLICILDALAVLKADAIVEPIVRIGRIAQVHCLIR